MKKSAVAIIIVILVILLILINLRSKENIVIGGTFALTNSLAYVGNDEKNGMEMAIEDINAKGGINGRKLTLIAEDNAGDAKNAVTGVQKLITVDKADVIYSAFTHITRAVAPVVSEAKIPLLYSAVDRTVAEDNRYFFRDYFDNIDIGKRLADSVLDNKYQKVKILSEISDSCNQLVNAFKEESTGKLVISKEELFQGTETDFRTHLTKLDLKENDALLVCAFKQVNILMKNMNELNLLGTQTFQLSAPSIPAANTPEIKELFSENQTVSSWYGFADKGNTKRQNEFILRYKEKFGVEPGSDSVFAYDDIMILKDVLKKCYKDKLDNECFEKEMLATDYDGVAGKLRFNQNRLSTRDTLLIQAKNGVWEKI